MQGYIIFLLQVLELLIKKMPLGLKIGIYNVKVFQVFLKEKYISIFITLLLIIKWFIIIVIFSFIMEGVFVNHILK